MSGSRPTARNWPKVQDIFAERTMFVPWLVIVTSDPDVLEGLAGVHAERRLGNHVRKLTLNVVNEASGVDDSATDRAIDAHASQHIFTLFPGAATNVLDGLTLVHRAHMLTTGQRSTGNEVEFGDFINHLAARHGQPDYGQTLYSRTTRLDLSVSGRLQSGQMPASAGPSLFWDVALEEKTLELLGVEATPDTVRAVMKLIRHVVPWYDIVDAYHQEGQRRLDQLLEQLK